MKMPCIKMSCNMWSRTGNSKMEGKMGDQEEEKSVRYEDGDT